MTSEKCAYERTNRMGSGPISESQNSFFREFFPGQTPHKVLQVCDTFGTSVVKYFAEYFVVGNA